MLDFEAIVNKLHSSDEGTIEFEASLHLMQK